MPTRTSIDLEPELGAQAAGAIADREARADGSQRVVLVHLVQAEDRHHGVADELLRAASQVQQLLRRRVVEAAEHVARAFGVDALREPRGVDEIGEQDRDDLPLVGAERARDRGSASGAEPRVVG
jgi:hypothetical protein